MTKADMHASPPAPARGRAESAASPTPYQLLPRLTDEEYAALKADVAENGIRVPIDVDELGAVLDGHHRSWIAADLGIDCPRRVLPGLTDEQKRTHAIAVNVHRRNLTREQRKEMVARLRNDGMSVRSIAKATGASVGTVAADLSTCSELNTSAVSGADGKTYPASRPAPALPPIPPLTYRDDHQPTDDGPDVSDWPRIPQPGATPPPSPKRRPLPDAFKDATYDLTKVMERLTRLVTDDRFNRNAEQVSGMSRGDLLRASEALAGVLKQLPDAP